jgi:glutaredoxin-like protein NrdH
MDSVASKSLDEGNVPHGPQTRVFAERASVSVLKNMERKEEQMTVVVYSTQKCGQCKMTYKDLERHNVNYEVIDVSGDEDMMSKLRDMGFKQFPVVMAGEESWNGFRPDKIRALAA